MSLVVDIEGWRISLYDSDTLDYRESDDDFDLVRAPTGDGCRAKLPDDSRQVS